MSEQTVTKHRSTRVWVERGVYKRQSGQSRTGWLYSVSHGGKFVSAEADGSPLHELTAARARRGELIGATRRGEKPVLATKTTFAELAEQWLAGKRLRPRTAAYYRDALRLVLIPRFGKLKIAQVDADAIVKLIRDLESKGLHAIDRSRPERPLGQASVENYVVKPLQGIFGLAVRRHLIAVNPVRLLTRDERPAREEKPPAYEWSGAEIDELLAASLRLARQPESRADYTPLLRLTVRLGLRLGEVLGLRWEDFDREGGYLHVRRQWCRDSSYGPPKTLAGVRSIPLPPDLQSALAALRLASSFSDESDPIFASRAGTPLMHRNVTRRGFEAARDEAGLSKGLSFHDLRHAAASRLIHEGHSPVVVAKILGHSDPAMTLRVYSHVYEKSETDEAIRRALAGAGS